MIEAQRKKYVLFYKGKITDFFTREKLRTFLQGKNYGLFYKGKITYFFTREKLRTFLQGKNYGLFYKGKITDFLHARGPHVKSTIFLVKTPVFFSKIKVSF